MVAARLRRPRHGERASSQKGCTGATVLGEPNGHPVRGPGAVSNPGNPCAQDRETRNGEDQG